MGGTVVLSANPGFESTARSESAAQSAHKTAGYGVDALV